MLLERLIEVCLLVSDVVSPIVAHSSPEGHVPEDAILGERVSSILQYIVHVKIIFGSLSLSSGAGLAVDLLSNMDSEDNNEERSKVKVNLMPEYLVVCCWRSIKEVSLLFGLVVQSCYANNMEGEASLISEKQVTSP